MMMIDDYTFLVGLNNIIFGNCIDLLFLLSQLFTSSASTRRSLGDR